MGLAEKRVVKQFQDENLPKIQEEMKTLSGVEIPFEVEWESLPDDGSASYLMEGLNYVYFLPVLEAFRSVCADEMGRESIAANLKKIVIRNHEPEPNYFEAITFVDGVLLIDQRLSNIEENYMKERAKKVLEALEAGL
jgi:hypothetical protein